LNLKKINKIEGGFSLIELIVVCAIISIIVGVVLLNFRGFQTKDTLDIAARTLASDLRWSQNAAMSGLSQGANKVYGYGIHFVQNTNNYIIFYNQNSSKTYGGSSSVRTVTLPSKITITSVTADVYFVPPDPTTYLNNNPSGSVTIELSYGTNKKQVIVNSSGLISY